MYFVKQVAIVKLLTYKLNCGYLCIVKFMFIKDFAVYALQRSPLNSGSVNWEILLIQTSDYAQPIVFTLYNSKLEHLIIRTIW